MSKNIGKTASQSENVITQIAQVKANSSLSEIPNYPVPNPGGSGAGEILAIIMGMTIFGCVVKKLMG
jgi:hypothetical protein